SALIRCTTAPAATSRPKPRPSATASGNQSEHVNVAGPVRLGRPRSRGSEHEGLIAIEGGFEVVVGVTMAVFQSAVILGIFLGTVYAMMALGIVASFRINRVVNLGIPGLAVFGATIYFQMSSV